MPRLPRGLFRTITSAAALAVLAPLALISSQAPAHADNIVTPGDFTGYGFDQCVAPTQTAMDAWLKHSPYFAVGIYISGDSRACRTQPNLNPTWISTQLNSGWRLLPIALGPQASCQPRFPRYKDDFKINPDPAGGYRTAWGQGAAEADKNANDAAAYGITAGSTIWYDLEGFDYTNTNCRESALVFVSSWVAQMKARGYVTGVYSSASSGIKMLDEARRLRPGQYNLPDRIWIARWDGAANTSTTYIPEDGWRPGGRMKQYLGGHNETYGGVTINIDSNYLDLGAGSVPSPESRCGGLKLGYWKYPSLTAARAQGSRVKVLQCLLTEQGLYSGPLDGVYDADVVAAANALQSAAGFAPTPVFEKQHWVALLARGSTPVVKYGSVGDPVYRLQRALNAAGAGKLKASGLFDDKTVMAVKAYQARTKTRVSGVGNPQTWRKLLKGKY